MSDKPHVCDFLCSMFSEQLARLKVLIVYFQDCALLCRRLNEKIIISNENIVYVLASKDTYYENSTVYGVAKDVITSNIYDIIVMHYEILTGSWKIKIMLMI